VVGFLVTTPTSGVDSILATYSLLGGAMMVIRVVASFLIGLGAGIATSLGIRKKESTEESPAKMSEEAPVRGNRITRSIAYGFGELLGGIARPLFIGTLLGGLIAYVLPPGVLEQYVGRGFLSYLVMLAVGIPLYVCASGSIPLAAALMTKGISPGAALVFLVSGPATNAATVTVVSKLLGRRALFIYLAFLIVGSFLAGMATDALFTWFPGWLPDFSVSGHHHMEGLSLFEIISGAFLGALTVFHVGKQLYGKLARPKKPDPGNFVLKVPDMTCQHCVATITNAVSGLPGVRGVNADPGTKLVYLDLADSQDSTEAVQAIEKAGYHPSEVKD
jgi:copper chaperone CopZ